MPTPGIAGRLAELQQRIADACREAGRSADAVELLAVSKTFPTDAIADAYAAGQRQFGESRQQEAEPKMAALPGDIRWHFIGGLQRNKARKVMAGFEVIHSVDSLRLAEHLDRIAREENRRPQIYLEVNLAGEASKGGFAPAELPAAAEALAGLTALEIAGLMVIPPDESEVAAARRWFAQARELRDRLKATTGLALPGLSMGMSGDFEAAILEGSTIVRVGSALFGSRDYPA